MDQTRQFDQIIGVPGICWTQDNKLFNRVGYEVDRDGKLIDPDDAKHAFDTPVGEEKPVVVDSRGVVPLAHLTDVHLKALVESYGEEYVNRDDALAYLQDMLDASSMHA